MCYLHLNHCSLECFIESIQTKEFYHGRLCHKNRDVSRQLSKQGSAASEEEIDFDVYYGDLSSFIMANFPPVPIINMADYEVDSDEEDE